MVLKIDKIKNKKFTLKKCKKGIFRLKIKKGDENERQLFLELKIQIITNRLGPLPYFLLCIPGPAATMAQ